MVSKPPGYHGKTPFQSYCESAILAMLVIGMVLFGLGAALVGLAFLLRGTGG